MMDIMGIQKSERCSAQILQWIARIIGTILSPAFIFIFAIQGVLFEEDIQEIAEIIPTLIIISIWIGFFIIAWFNELVGAIGTIFWAINWSFPIYFTSGHNKFIVSILLPLPFLIVGVLFLIALFLEKSFQKKNKLTKIGVYFCKCCFQFIQFVF